MMKEPLYLAVRGSDLRKQLAELRVLQPHHDFTPAEILGAALCEAQEKTPDRFEFADDDLVVLALVSGNARDFGPKPTVTVPEDFLSPGIKES